MLKAMLGFVKKDRPSRLVAFRIYLIIILACTLLLFALNVVSLTRQQDSLNQLAQGASAREIWFAGLATWMFLCIISLGIYLLIRVSRDLQWFQLQSDFVSGISHELKTPLSLIRLYSETLVDGEEAFTAEERNSYIRIIARESERLSRLIDNVLDFSKIRQGQRPRILQPGNLAETVSQTVADYSEYLALRGFVVKTGFQPNLPTVLFNREQVSQLVLNLMDNARKYSGDSRLIRIHMWRQVDEVVVEVQDYGFGIPAAEQEKIFEPFYRLARGSEKGGCGLGLYLVQQVMKDHGGRIEVQSHLDQGTRFRLFFPVPEAGRENYGLPDTYDPGNRSIIQAG